MKFQKRPEIIDAIRWDGSEECERRIQQMAGPGVFADRRKASPPIVVPTRSGQVRGEIGGWVTRNATGVLDYKPHDVMLLTYMPAGEGNEVGGEPPRQESLEEVVGRIVEAKMAERFDPVPDSPIDLPEGSFTQDPILKEES
jgi:hypothetical protein